eukprot:4160138-Prymnesium_polylepis.1
MRETLAGCEWRLWRKREAIECAVRVSYRETSMRLDDVAAAPTERLSTCRVCKQSFRASENHDRACCFHPAGRMMGAENTKHSGTRVGVKPGLTVFWDCCASEDPDNPGCCFGRHMTYDD